MFDFPVAEKVSVYSKAKRQAQVRKSFIQSVDLILLYVFYFVIQELDTVDMMTDKQANKQTSLPSQLII